MKFQSSVLLALVLALSGCGKSDSEALPAFSAICGYWDGDSFVENNLEDNLEYVDKILYLVETAAEIDLKASAPFLSGVTLLGRALEEVEEYSELELKSQNTLKAQPENKEFIQEKINGFQSEARSAKIRATGGLNKACKDLFGEDSE